jgi:hypothetical protein
MLHHIIQWCNAAQLQFSPDDQAAQPPYQTTATPFLKLLLTFESVFLAPSARDQSTQQSFHHLLSHRFELLKTGDIQNLYLATRTLDDISHTTLTKIPTFDNLGHNRAAQVAADQDNLHTAYN